MAKHKSNIIILVLCLAMLPVGSVKAQTQPAPGNSIAPSTAVAIESKTDLATKSAALNPPGVNQNYYVKPSDQTRLHNFVFDAFGPYPVVGSAFVGAINQMDDSPPEWRQGASGYFKRFGSDYGVAAVATTTRYGLAGALHQDTLYYRCDCVGVFPRIRHALFSTLTARSGSDGHRVFSIPALVAPYAGTITAVYAWYPNRYGAKDAFRMGSYGLLAYAGSNLSLEFFYSGPHSLLSRLHLNNGHGAPEPGPNHAPES